MKRLVIILALLLALLHQDFWFWDEATLVLGFLPVGLAYHAAFSISAALLWAIAIKVAWPTKLVDWAERDDGGANP